MTSSRLVLAPAFVGAGPPAEQALSPQAKPTVIAARRRRFTMGLPSRCGVPAAAGGRRVPRTVTRGPVPPQVLASSGSGSPLSVDGALALRS